MPERQYLRKVKLAEGSSVEQAIQASGLLELRRDIDLKSNKIGIYSRPAKLGDTLNDGDRVEIYRPLIADPKSCAGNGQKGKNKALIAPYFYLKLIFSSALQPATVMRNTMPLMGRKSGQRRLLGQRRFVLDVGQHACAVEGQRQRLLGDIFMAGCWRNT